jgi:hypothetical protein
MGITAGAGNPAGSGGTSGVGTGITYLGSHAYANSGNVNVPNGSTGTLLRFTTGGAYIDAIITGGRNAKSASESTTIIKFNDEVVFQGKYDDGAARGFTMVPWNGNIYILIPPYTSFLMTLSANDADDDGINVTLRGDVYYS